MIFAHKDINGKLFIQGTEIVRIKDFWLIYPHNGIEGPQFTWYILYLFETILSIILGRCLLSAGG